MCAGNTFDARRMGNSAMVVFADSLLGGVLTFLCVWFTANVDT
jgi:hypothetical protein